MVAPTNLEKNRTVFRSVSGFLNELFLALRTGDGDFALTLGDTDTLMATGAFIIAVLLILHTIPKPQPGPVFPVALVGVPG